MRIAVLIIGLCLTMFVFLQSCAVSVGGGMAQDESAAGGGAIGILIAFLFVLGSAFVLSLPKVSVWIFAIASVLGFLVGASTAFSDMTVWAVISAALAVMSWFGARDLARKKTGAA